MNFKTESQPGCSGGTYNLPAEGGEEDMASRGCEALASILGSDDDNHNDSEDKDTSDDADFQISGISVQIMITFMTHLTH